MSDLAWSKAGSRNSVLGAWRAAVLNSSLTKVAADPATIPFGYSKLMDLIFEIRDADESGFYARALGYSIFTEADSWDELRAKVIDAVALHFEDSTTRPRLVQMHYVKDELIPLEA